MLRTFKRVAPSIVILAMGLSCAHKPPIDKEISPIPRNLRMMAEQSGYFASIRKDMKERRNEVCEPSASEMLCFSELANKFPSKTSAFFVLYLAGLTDSSGARAHKLKPDQQLEFLDLAIRTQRSLKVDSLFSSRMEIKTSDEEEKRLMLNEERSFLEATLLKFKEIGGRLLKQIEKASISLPRDTKKKRMEEIASFRKRLGELKIE